MRKSLIAFFLIILGFNVQGQPWDGYLAFSSRSAGGRSSELPLYPTDSITVEYFVKRGCITNGTKEGSLAIIQRVGLTTRSVSLSRLSNHALYVCESASTCVSFGGTDGSLTWDKADSQWVHVAFQVYNWFSSGRLYIKVYFDGIEVVDGSFSQTDLERNRKIRLYLGDKVPMNGGYSSMNFYMDQLRVSKGWRYHASSFVPPDSVFQWDSATVDIWDFDEDYIEPGGNNQLLISRGGRSIEVDLPHTYICFADPVRQESKVLISGDTICPNQALKGSGGNVYEWYPTEIFDDSSSRTPRITVVDTTVIITMISRDTMFCRVDTASLQLYIAPAPKINLPSDTMKCKYENLQFDLKEGVSYHWSPVIALSDSIGPSPFTTTQVDQTYYIDIVDSFGCPYLDSTSIVIYQTIYPTLPDTVRLCEGDTLGTLPLDSTIQYRWSPRNLFTIDSVPNPPVKRDTIGWVFIRMVDTNACTKLDSLFLIARPKPTFHLAKDTSKCKYESIKLTVSESGDKLWSSLRGEFDDSTLATVRYTGRVLDTLTVRLTDTFGCAQVKNMAMDILPHYYALPYSDTSLCTFDSLQLVTDTVLSVNWFDNNGWHSQLVNPWYTVMDSGWVIASATDTLGCSVTDSISLTATPSFLMTGQAYTSDNIPLANSMITALIKNSHGNWVSHSSTQSTTSGFYQLQLYADTFRIRIEPDTAQYPLQLITYYDSAITIHSASNIVPSFCSIDTVGLVTISASNITGSAGVSGFLLEGEGKMVGNGDPIPNMRLVLMKEGITPNAETITDHNGYFSFRGLINGNYSLWADTIAAINQDAPSVSVSIGQQIDSLIVKWKNNRLTIDTSTGIRNKPRLGATWVFPNPSSSENSYLYLDEPHQNSEIHLSISNIHGQQVAVGSFAYRNRIRLPKVDRAGVYLIEVTYDESSAIVKWVVN